MGKHELTRYCIGGVTHIDVRDHRVVHVDDPENVWMLGRPINEVVLSCREWRLSVTSWCPWYRVGIVGSREFPDRHAVEQLVASLPEEVVVVSGGARGVDTWAIEAAKRRDMRTLVLPADWQRYGKSAGMRRNTELVRIVNIVHAFWDGKSRGTQHTIELARESGCLGSVVIDATPPKQIAPREYVGI